MQGAALRESFKFQRRAQVSDGMGGTDTPWTDLCGPFRARKRPINGREEVLAQKLSGVQPFELLTRYNAQLAALTTADRAVDARSGTAYDITAIQNPDERQMWLSILIKSGEVSDG